MHPHEESDLHAAVAACDVEEVKDLLGRGPTFDSRTHFSMTPLMLAAQLGYDEIVGILVDAGQKLDVKSRVNSFGGGLTALHFAAERGRLRACQILLKAGANPNVASADKMTALNYAIHDKNEAVVQCLLENGADPNGSKTCRETPLVSAVSLKQVPILRTVNSTRQPKHPWCQ